MANTGESAKPPFSEFLRHPPIRAALPFAIGGFSGMVATTCIQPVEMVKVRMQISGEGVRDTPRAMPLSVARGIVAQGKILDLYSGLSAGLLRQAVYATSRLGFFDTFERILKERARKNGIEIVFGERALASIAAGGLGAMIGNPADLALIRMQSDDLQPKTQRANYRSVFDALARISKSEGFLALWKGGHPTIIRAMSTNFGQLAFFSESKNQIQQHTTLSPRTQTFAASAIAGFFAAFFSLPFDFVKTRLQKQTIAPDGSVTYKGMLDCFVKVAKDEGLLRFYRGFGTYFLRIAPHS
jgi:solute carrier family 25 oxoglutarate transporter 11